ncbi:MAG: thiamine-phosphate kinase [Gammaproteobacteria bacterium]|nr:thiamine-phosphate kinase [Gammaproteobacteria bacterium]
MASEFELIRRFFAESSHQFQRSEVILGIGDDAAVLEIPKGQQLCVATDVLIADVHFPADAPADLIAHRALAVNLSDLAAMGAAPLCFTLGLAVNEVSEAWMERFSGGLFDLAQQYNCPLVGGDTVRGPLSISITVHGLVDKTVMIRRHGAVVGDKILVSGFLGDGALALLAMGLDSHLVASKVLMQGEIPMNCRDTFLAAFFQPKPRIKLAQACATLVSCGIDLSDGLVSDLGHILMANGLGASINVDALPISSAARSFADSKLSHAAALFGGDDYELCLCVPPENLSAVKSIANSLAIDLSCVGEITKNTDLYLHDSRGMKLDFDQSSYAHFVNPIQAER